MDLLNGSEECCFKLSNEGIPLNPSGRTGLAGRGNYPKFGPNVLYISVIVWDDPSGTIKVSIYLEFSVLYKDRIVYKRFNPNARI